VPPVPTIPAEPTQHALLDVRGVAGLLGCSVRHVYRMADGGRMPAPLKLGALVRWRRADLERWLDQGAPVVRKSPSR
jgi:excisionase family DNA binding protein